MTLIVQKDGFMLYDFKKAMPKLTVEGIDISEYAINNCKKEIETYVHIGDAWKLSQYKDKEFDLVISITTLHNLKLYDCKKSIEEVQQKMLSYFKYKENTNQLIHNSSFNVLEEI